MLWEIFCYKPTFIYTSTVNSDVFSIHWWVFESKTGIWTFVAGTVLKRFESKCTRNAQSTQSWISTALQEPWINKNSDKSSIISFCIFLMQPFEEQLCGTQVRQEFVFLVATLAPRLSLRVNHSATLSIIRLKRWYSPWMHMLKRQSTSQMLWNVYFASWKVWSILTKGWSLKWSKALPHEVA